MLENRTVVSWHFIKVVLFTMSTVKHVFAHNLLGHQIVNNVIINQINYMITQILIPKQHKCNHIIFKKSVSKIHY